MSESVRELEDDVETRLDGNAAAGLLAELFCGEASSAVIVCAGCNTGAPVARLMAYGLEMGVILRCAACDAPVMRVGATGLRRWVDLRGAASLRFELSAPA
jgi:hypothetical protein